MKLTRQQIEKLHQVYNHFHEINEFTVTVDDNDMVSVSFDMKDIPNKVKISKSKEFIPQVYK
jgi:hypothetical protein